MSGSPSWAITDRSLYYQRMDDALAVDQHFDLRLRISKSHRGFDDLQPLFIKVAESMVILAPIFQFGCCKARSGPTSWVAAREVPERPARGGRDHVSRLPGDGVHRLKDGAVLTVDGKMWTWCFLASACIRGSAMTIGSLLASAICLPALIAITWGQGPAPPTMAEITSSASGDCAT